MCNSLWCDSCRRWSPRSRPHFPSRWADSSSANPCQIRTCSLNQTAPFSNRYRRPSGASPPCGTHPAEGGEKGSSREYWAFWGQCMPVRQPEARRIRSGIRLAPQVGFEPATFWLTEGRQRKGLSGLETISRIDFGVDFSPLESHACPEQTKCMAGRRCEAAPTATGPDGDKSRATALVDCFIVRVGGRTPSAPVGPWPSREAPPARRGAFVGKQVTSTSACFYDRVRRTPSPASSDSETKRSCGWLCPRCGGTMTLIEMLSAQQIRCRRSV